MQERIPSAVLWLAASLSAQILPQPGGGRARLEGLVLDPLRAPVPNALVVAELDGLEVARTRSDGSGTFLLPRLPQAFVVVRATSAGPDVGALQIDLLGEQCGFAEIVLLPARRVAGLVKDEDGKPVAGAWVAAAPTDLPQLALASCTARSGADGRYELGHVLMGPARVVAWAEGFDAADEDVDGTADVALDCELSREAWTSRTIELAGGAAAEVERAVLIVESWQGPRRFPLPPPLARPAAEAPGRWVLRGWPRADLLRARFDMPGACIDPPENGHLGGDRTTSCTFQLGSAAHRLRGRIADAPGLLAAGLPLMVQATSDMPGNGQRRTAVVRADGSFELPSPVDPRGEYALRTLSPVAVLQGNNPNPVWWVARHEPGSELVLQLQRAHGVRMRLRTPAGAPARGCDVCFRARLAAPQHGGWLPIGIGSSDLDGNVEIACLGLPADALFQLRLVGRDGWLVQDVEPGSAGVTDAGPLTLQPCGAVSGTVQAEDGTPAPGARFWLQAADAPGDRPRRRLLVAGRHGRFCCDGLVPGAVGLQLPDGGTTRAVVEAGEATAVALVAR